MNRAPVSRILPFFVAIFLSLSFFHLTEAEARHKLGSQLRSFKKVKITQDNIREVSKKGHFKLFMKDKHAFVGVLIKAGPDAEQALRQFGAENIRRHGQVYTAHIPVDSLEELADLDEILYMRAARKLKPHLDVSVPILPADSVGLEVERASTPVIVDLVEYLTYPPPWLTGSGASVVFGVVDTGIDWNHWDFKDTGGDTRIKYLWEQNEMPDPDVFCDEAQIKAGTCPHADTDGHGTHVTGIAAGNGQATGNSLPNYRYVGVAPEADIIAVATTFWDDDILDGVAYIFEKADDLEQTAVVNLSLGGHFGPHDGTDPFDLCLDTMAGPGQIVVTSAGNEGNDYIHNQGVWSGSDVQFRFKRQSVALGYLNFTIWHNGLDSYQVRIKSPQNDQYTWGVGVTSTQPLQDMSVTVANPAYGETEYNGDKEITISMYGVLPKNNWSIYLVGDIVSPDDPNRIDAWIWRNNFRAYFTNGDNDISVGSPGTAKSVITVGSYTTKDVWYDINGFGWTYGYTEEDITPFSSLGPTRDGRLKPDIVAPGSVIGSALSADAPYEPDYVLPDGVHQVMQGTSMSCPHITGLSALLLEKHPTYTPAAIKSILAYTARDDTWVDPPPPNTTWGYGKAHAVAALAVADADRPMCATAEQYPAPATVDNTLVAEGLGFMPKEGGSPARYLYQWQKYNGLYFENIPGANYKRLEPQAFSAGDNIRLVVTPYEHMNEPQYQDLLLGASQVMTQPQPIGAGSSFVSHTGGEPWCMVSIPTQSDSAILNDFAALFYLWDELAQNYDAASTIERGRGYWVYVLDGEGYMHSEGDSVPAGDFITPLLTYTDGVKPGRHLIGNPFNKPIYWENIYVSTDPDPVPASFTIRVGDPEAAALIDNMYYADYDNVEGQYHYYDPGDFEQRDGKIFPWEGLWVIVKPGADVHLMIPEVQSVPATVRDYGDYPLPVYAENGKADAKVKSAQSPYAASKGTDKDSASAQKSKGPKKKDIETSGERWRMKIAAYSGQLRDDYNYLGIHPDSFDGYDRKDILDAGTMNAAHVMIYMEYNDWGSNSGKYCVDMHSNTGELHQWEISAKATGLVDPVTIFWKKLPSGWDLELLDTTAQVRVDMKDSNTYTYSPNGDEERSFIIQGRRGKK